MRKILYTLLFYPLVLSADKAIVSPNPEAPWFTGPLLTPTPAVVQGGHINLQPYIYMDNNIGYFNNHWHIHRFSDTKSNVNFQFYTWVGLNKYMDLFIDPQFFFNYEDGVDSWEVGDPTLGLDIQLLERDLHDPWPAIKLSIYELFPLGRYQRLSAKKLGTDAGGGGTYVTTIALVLGYIWTFGFPHYFSLRGFIDYEFSTKVKVHGINAYGGDPTTVGTVYPGSDIDVYIGGEYSLTHNWVLACDIASIYSFPTRFKGHTIAPVGNKNNSYQFSIAPAIEYNFSAKVGMIAGVWFTLFGKNTFDFINGIISIDWYI